MFSHLRNELVATIWTLAGTALVLITLSGETQKKGLIISGGAFLLHVFGLMFTKSDE
jgi:hypothetical protein